MPSIVIQAAADVQNGVGRGGDAAQREVLKGLGFSRAEQKFELRGGFSWVRTFSDGLKCIDVLRFSRAQTDLSL